MSSQVGEVIDWRQALSSAVGHASSSGSAESWALIADTMLRAGVTAQLGPGGQWIIKDQAQ